MLARPILIGVMALSTLLHQPRMGPTVPVRFLLSDSGFSADVPNLIVAEVDDVSGMPLALRVQLAGYFLPPGEKSLLANMMIQVWLLRADGTALARHEKVRFDDPTSFKPSIDSMEFWFVPVPAKELAGVVASVNGKLFAREIKAS